MQTTSALYKSIFASVHRKEWKVSINGTEYGQDKIVKSIGGTGCEPRVIHDMFPEATPSVGNCVAGVFTCTMLLQSSAIPRMAEIKPYYRLVGASNSEWLQAGTYYIDTRSADEETGTVALVCYDAILKMDGAGGKSYAELSSYTDEGEWPISMSAVVTEIASIIGVTLDSRNVINSGVAYMVNYPNDYSMREVMGYIAAAHGANWSMTPAGKLRLVPLTGDNTDTLALGSKVGDLKLSPAFAAWSQVILYWADEEAYASGSDTGRTLEADDPWAEQGTADGILTVISGTTYQPFSAGNALIDPAVELGDKVTFTSGSSTITAHLWSLEMVCDSLTTANIEAPGEEAVDHEYPYVSASARQMKRMVKLGQPYYGVTISKKSGIEIVGVDGQGNERSKAIFNSDQFEMDAYMDGAWKKRIYFDPIKGDYVFDGALGADAVFTDSLYAETGDVAELTVDRLSTSRRIRKYILGDTSDDNYIAIQDNYIKFITGAPVSNAILLTQTGDYIITEDELFLTLETSDYVTTQATNRYGEPLYWQREPVGHTADGYPTDTDGKQIYATTDETDWPVTIYLYKELVKMQEAFELTEGVYQPQVILGAGDENGNSKGYIYKAQQNLLMRYVSSSGKNVDITWSDDGFVDAMHRRLSSCDIDPDLGLVTYFVEGDELGHQLTFTVSGDTVTYTWPDGFECTVTIPEDAE